MVQQFRIDTSYAVVGGYVRTTGAMAAAKIALERLRKRGNSSLLKPERTTKDLANCAITDNKNKVTYFRIS